MEEHNYSEGDLEEIWEGEGLGGDKISEAEEAYMRDGRIKHRYKFNNLSKENIKKESYKTEGVEKVEINKEEFGQLLSYIEGDKKISDREIVEKFKNASESLERLNLLRFMSAADRIECISNYSKSPVAAVYLKGRLDFYQKVINGGATRNKEVWDSDSGRMVKKQVALDPSDVKPESIYLGLLRDSMYAAMQGTPEMAAIKIATNNTNRRNAEIYFNKKECGEEVSEPKRIRSVVELWGYYSGVNNRSIGMYEHAINLYKRCEGQIKEELTGQEIGKDEIEHKTVLLMAKRLEDANQYDGVMNNSASPYEASLKEAVIAGQLGNRVMRQMAGMRNKIQETDFSHISRFIGKSGDNKYEREKYRLDYQIEFLINATDKEEISEFVAEENLIAVNKLEKWYRLQAVQMAKKASEGKMSLAENALISGEDKGAGVKLNIDSAIFSEPDEYRQRLEKIEHDYRARRDYLQNRNLEQLSADLKARKEIVDKRFEKRKSLAQKALDLHFAINHLNEEERKRADRFYEEGNTKEAGLVKPFSEIIDWINFAPLGTIKRSHRFLCQGVDQELIVRQALLDIFIRKGNINPGGEEDQGERTFEEYDLKDIAGAAQKADKSDIEASKIINDLVGKIKDGNYGAKYELEHLVKTVNILNTNGYHLDINEVSELADKVEEPSGFARALGSYSLDEIKNFLQSGTRNLHGIAAVKEASIKSGYDFTNEEIMEIVRSGYQDQQMIIDAARFFNREEFKKLINKGINLYAANDAYAICRQYGHHLTVEQISEVANTIEEGDLSKALEILTLDQALEIYSQGINFSTFGILKDELAGHGYASDFESVKHCLKELSAFSSKDGLERLIDNMGDVFDYYSFEEIKEIVKRRMDLDEMARLKMRLEEKNINLDFAKTLELARIAKTKYSGGISHYVSLAMAKFGENGMFRLVNKGCPLDIAVTVKDQIDSGSYRDKSYNLKEIDARVLGKIRGMGLDAIIAISKSGGEIEAITKTIAAGFNFDEIARYPFLISSLIDKK